MCLALTAIIAGVSGCAKSVGALDAADERDPLMERASRLDRSNDFEGAIETYQEALELNAGLVKAHLRLGLLYDDYENNYLRAIYHYQRYLELRPDSEKYAEIEELIRLARVNYATSIPEQASDAIRELTRVRQQASQMEQDMAVAKRRIAALEVENGKLTTALGTARKRIVADKGQVPARGSSRTSAAAAPADKAISYTVQRGDTLSRIATKMYDDSRKWKAIYHANRTALDSPESLKVGQILEIPISQSDGG
jgi:tetratricopeptide (TPR) repeat protein